MRGHPWESGGFLRTGLLGEGGGEGAWGDPGETTRGSRRVSICAPAKAEVDQEEGCGAACACAALAPVAPLPPPPVPKLQHPCARVPARGREEGRAGPPPRARGHVTPAEEIGAAAARGGRLVQRLALTEGSLPPPPPLPPPPSCSSFWSFDGTFSSARLAAAAAASPSTAARRGGGEDAAGPPPLEGSPAAARSVDRRLRDHPPAGSPLPPPNAAGARWPQRWGSWTRSRAAS